MFLVIDKPKGMTSHDVVDFLRKKTGERKVGHAGTLDPNATGVLVLGVGRESTKLLGEITKNTEKEYLASIYLGEERDTDDIEGKVQKTNVQIKPSEDEVRKVITGFIGEIEQIPPAFSAIKKFGKKSYDLARAGKQVDMEPRLVKVVNANVMSYDYPIVKVEYCVSSGTYIRALARDVGRKLGTYGYLSDLRRTRVGEYRIENAKKLEEL